MFFHFVTKHACDWRTDRTTITKMALAQLLCALKIDQEMQS